MCWCCAPGWVTDAERRCGGHAQVNIEKMLKVFTEGIFAGPKTVEAAAALSNLAEDKSKIISED